MPIGSAYSQTHFPDFFAPIDSWTLVTNSLSRQPSLYLYSGGILRVQIVPMNSERSIPLQDIPNSPYKLLTLNSHDFNITGFFYPFITACDEIEVSILDYATYIEKADILDIDWKFIKKA